VETAAALEVGVQVDRELLGRRFLGQLGLADPLP
jgi:hypothetical protein